MEEKIKEVTLDGKAKVSINIPKKVLKMLDEDRKKMNYTRSSWLTMAAMERLMTPRIWSLRRLRLNC